MNPQFISCLQNNSLDGLRLIPKSDLHNHAGKGGNVRYIASQENISIKKPPEFFESLFQMDSWFAENIKKYTTYLKRLEAAFVQANDDFIQVLAMSFGVDEAGTVGGFPLQEFIPTMKEYNRRFAPSTILLPELHYDRACNVDFAYGQMDEILSYHWFRSIDICNDEFAQPIGNFKKMYRKAKESGLLLKAHVGEYGTADDIWEAVEELELDEVHHGIAAAKSAAVMKQLADWRIQLNICPSSNVMLKRVESYARHPIRILYDYGVPVTINTDDMLIFNQSVSEEYRNLYESGLMTAEELDAIRETGLNEIKTITE